MDTTTDDVRTAELRAEIVARRDDIGRDLEVIGDRVSPGRVADRTRERGRRRLVVLRERVMGPVEQAKSSFGEVRHTAGDAASSATDHDPAAAVTEKVEGSPLMMGMIAFGIGFVAGSIAPASRPEQQLARKIEPQVTQLAQDAVEAAKDAGEHVAPAVKEEASAVKDEAQQAVGNVADKGKQEAAAAREEVRHSSS